MKIAVYSRKSRFTGKGESVENQVRLCKDYISRHLDCAEDAAIDVYEDEGFSGKNTARPQFQKMMAEARQKSYDYIVCYRLDRISRNVSDFSALIDELQQCKTSFICIREQFDTSTPMGRAMMYIASVFAQLERETIAERIRDNMLLLARTGRWLGGNTPLGFTSTQMRKDTSDGKEKTAFKLKPVPEEIEIVTFIYASYLELRSMAELERQLMERDVKTRKGKYFTSAAIREILCNPVYCVADQAAHRYFQKLGADICFDKKDFDGNHGIAAYNRTSHGHDGQTGNEPAGWIISIGGHKGVIESGRWIQAQRILQANRHGPAHKRVHNPVSLLSGLLVCGKCGSKMRPRVNSSKATGADGSRTFSYLCERKKRSKGQKCDCENLNGNEADRAVCESCLRLYKAGDGIHSKISALKDTAANRKKASFQTVQSLQVRIQDKKDSIQALLAVLARDSGNTSLYRHTEAGVARLDRELALLDEQLRRRINENADGDDDNTAAATEIEEKAKTVADAFRHCSIYEKRELLAALVDRVVWDGARVHIYMAGERRD